MDPTRLIKSAIAGVQLQTDHGMEDFVSPVSLEALEKRVPFGPDSPVGRAVQLPAVSGRKSIFDRIEGGPKAFSARAGGRMGHRRVLNERNVPEKGISTARVGSVGDRFSGPGRERIVLTSGRSSWPATRPVSGPVTRPSRGGMIDYSDLHPSENNGEFQTGDGGGRGIRRVTKPHVQSAFIRSGTDPRVRGDDRWQHDMYNGPQDAVGSQVFLRNLPQRVTEEQLSRLMSKAGEVVSIKIDVGPIPTATVNFVRADAAPHAVDTFNGRPLSILFGTGSQNSGSLKATVIDTSAIMPSDLKNDEQKELQQLLDEANWNGLNPSKQLISHRRVMRGKGQVHPSSEGGFLPSDQPRKSVFERLG